MSEIVATLSVAAFDPETESLGMAVQSGFSAGGAATQASADASHGPRGLTLMAREKAAG